MNCFQEVGCIAKRNESLQGNGDGRLAGQETNRDRLGASPPFARSCLTEVAAAGQQRSTLACGNKSRDR